MKDFTKSKFTKGGPRKFSGRDFDRPREMFTATCNQCRKACEVPFRPNGKKPVYCSDCYVKDDGDAPRDSYPRRDFAPRQSFNKPYSAPVADRSASELKMQLEAANVKLDRLIMAVETLAKALTPAAPEVKAAPAKKPAKKVAAKKK